MAVYRPGGVKKIFHATRRKFAQNWLKQFHPLQIGITGSQGKTNTTAIITAICRALGPTVVTDTNLDTTYNVPITALSVRKQTQYVIWELGIDYPGEMDQHLHIAKPFIGVITGISPVHTDAEHMGSLEKLIEEKRKLIESLPRSGYAILNYDDENVRNMAAFTKAQVVWYGSDPAHCNVWVQTEKTGGKIRQTLDGLQVRIHDKQEFFDLKIPLMGLHNAFNLLVGYLVLKIIKKEESLDNIIITFKSIVKTLSPLRGRMNIEPGPLHTIVLNDSLRANPQSTDSGLRTLAALEYTEGRKIAVIGEMGELEYPQAEHEKTAEAFAYLNLDYIICIGPLRKFTVDKAIALGFPAAKIFYAKDIFAAADHLKSFVLPKDLIYLKGSFLRNYKRILQLLNGEKICCNAEICPYSHCGY